MFPNNQLTSDTSETASGRCHPLEILEEELWLKILTEKLPSETVHACYNSCPTFRTLLEPLRTTFLFPQVLPLLDTSSHYFFEVELAAPRLVCRTWKQVLDNYLVSPLFRGRNWQRDHDELYWFFGEKDVTRFLQFMESRPKPGGNPFITRDVTFTDDHFQEVEEDDFNRYWRAMASLLRVYGEHIWFAKIQTQGAPRLTSLYQEFLLPCVTHMRNLKKLEVWDGSDDVVWLEEGPDLEELIRTSPLPTRSWISLDVGRLPRPMSRELVRAANAVTLESLKFSDDNKQTANALGDIAKFENLKSLRLQLRGETQLDRLSGVRWPLRKAILTVKLGSITFPKLFRWLNRYGETFSELYLILSGKDNYPGNTSRRLTELQLPVLKKLDLVTDRGSEVRLCSLDFLAGLPALEELEVVCFQVLGFCCEERHQHRIRFPDISKLLHSNLWEICEGLTDVYLKDKTGCFSYIREGSTIRMLKET